MCDSVSAKYVYRALSTAAEGVQTLLQSGGTKYRYHYTNQGLPGACLNPIDIKATWSPVDGYEYKYRSALLNFGFRA